MKMISAALALSAFPTLVAADDWRGIWAADPDWCQYKDQLGNHDPTPVMFSSAEFIGYENRCKLGGVEKQGELPAWRITLTCSGEGMTYDEETLLMLSEDGRLWQFDGFSEPYAYVRCE